MKKLVKTIATIGLFLSWPLTFIRVFFRIPNTRIVYKNGHVEEFFFVKYKFIKYESFTWVSIGKAPKIIGVDEVMTITELY